MRTRVLSVKSDLCAGVTWQAAVSSWDDLRVRSRPGSDGGGRGLPGAATAAVLDRRPDARQRHRGRNLVRRPSSACTAPSRTAPRWRRPRPGYRRARPGWPSTTCARSGCGERYVGAWLPEPLVTDQEADAARHAETTETHSLAFLMMLERLSPVQGGCTTCSATATPRMPGWSVGPRATAVRSRHGPAASSRPAAQIRGLATAARGAALGSRSVALCQPAAC
jgi:hypothetical protein